MEIQEIFKNYIKELKNNGFAVYTSDTKEQPSYINFTKDNKIGYCQYDRFGGVTFSTVHKPCKECGTGFRVTENDGTYEPTIKDAESSLIFAPNWATPKDKQAIVKYKSWEEYNSKSHLKNIQL